MSFIVSFLALHCTVTKGTIERTLKIQLIVTTIIMIPVLYWLSVSMLPAKFGFRFSAGNEYTALGPFWAALAGCVSGMIIGLITEYYTSYSYTPVTELIDNCLDKGGNAATNIVYGLALGYLSCIVPVFCLAITI